MVAVGGPRLSIGCYSVPQQTGSVASAAAVNSRGCQPSRVAGFVQGLFVSLSERCGRNRGAGPHGAASVTASNFLLYRLQRSATARQGMFCSEKRSLPPWPCFASVLHGASFWCGVRGFCRHYSCKRSLYLLRTRPGRAVDALAKFRHRCGTFKPVLRQCSLKPADTNHALPVHFDANSRPQPRTEQ